MTCGRIGMRVTGATMGTRWLIRLGGAAACVPLLVLGSCTANREQPGAAQVAAAAPAIVAASLTVTPVNEATDLPISTEIGTIVSEGRPTSVTLVGDGGGVVTGRMRADDTSWVPDQPLSFGARYTATVIAAGADGKTVSMVSTFTTMLDPPHRVDTGLYLFDDQTYGVAMPIVVEFTADVEDSSRAGVQSRLFVTTEPEQPGVWHWTGPRQITYRAERYWQPGTTITVRIGLDGHPLGAGRYGDTDRRAVGHIATDKVELFIDNTTKHLSVRQNGETIREMPVSLGKPSTPSSSGTMVIMEKKVRTVFDTAGEPGDQYRADISYAQRLTWGGEFIHAAPWSVGDQGVNNVSHGCVNMSWGDAEWLFGVTHVGDPVSVVGTEQSLEPGNGFTAWNLSWSDYLKGSALPIR